MKKKLIFNSRTREYEFVKNKQQVDDYISLDCLGKINSHFPRILKKYEELFNEIENYRILESLELNDLQKLCDFFRKFSMYHEILLWCKNEFDLDENLMYVEPIINFYWNEVKSVMDNINLGIKNTTTEFELSKSIIPNMPSDIDMNCGEVEEPVIPINIVSYEVENIDYHSLLVNCNYQNNLLCFSEIENNPFSLKEYEEYLRETIIQYDHQIRITISLLNNIRSMRDIQKTTIQFDKLIYLECLMRWVLSRFIANESELLSYEVSIIYQLEQMLNNSMKNINELFLKIIEKTYNINDSEKKLKYIHINKNTSFDLPINIKM